MVSYGLRFLVAAILVVVIGFGMSGCASMSSDNAAPTEAQKQQLKQRAESRWEALIKGELQLVYAFMSPDYRNVVSLQQFKSRYGRTVEWRLARIDDIRYDSPTVASVMMGVAYRTMLPGARGDMFENRKTLTEKWLFKDGEWWYIDQ